MLRLLAPAAFVSVVLASAAVLAQDVQYVGNSDPGRRRSGGAGILEFNEECVTDFGPNARICSSLEVLQTIQSTTVPDRENNDIRQWVVPTIVAGSSTGIDASGIAGAAGTLTCNGWSTQSSSFKGLTVDDFGRFSTQTCVGTRQIACCTPVP